MHEIALDVMKYNSLGVYLAALLLQVCVECQADKILKEDNAVGLSLFLYNPALS